MESDFTILVVVLVIMFGLIIPCTLPTIFRQPTKARIITMIILSAIIVPPVVEHLVFDILNIFTDTHLTSITYYGGHPYVRLIATLGAIIVGVRCLTDYNVLYGGDDTGVEVEPARIYPLRGNDLSIRNKTSISIDVGMENISYNSSTQMVHARIANRIVIPDGYVGVVTTHTRSNHAYRYVNPILTGCTFSPFGDGEYSTVIMGGETRKCMDIHMRALDAGRISDVYESSDEVGLTVTITLVCSEDHNGPMWDYNSIDEV